MSYSLTPKERMKRLEQGMKADHVPFMPTIFEHSAKFVNKTPSEVAVDENLITEAQIKAYNTYNHDSVTVGIDVYNIEAEALGCKVKYHDDNSIPGISLHPMEQNIDIKKIEFSCRIGRINTILKAAENINKVIGKEVNVNVGICGPFSIAVELLGYDILIFKCMEKPQDIHSLLKAVLEFQKKYCDEIIKRDLTITIFESWATPPLVTPNIYREFIMPYEGELISYIKECGLSKVPLVIGGDTTMIVDDIISTGTTMLVADYKVDLDSYLNKASSHNILLRGNIDPKLIEKGTIKEILSNVKKTLKKVEGYNNFVLGTGVISYDTPIKNILAIKEYIKNIG